METFTEQYVRNISVFWY